MKVHIVGNSHVWTVMGWEQLASRDSVRMASTADGLEMVGMAITGATAHNLISTHSSTDSGAKVSGLLDSDPARKDVLLVFGDIDVRRHIRDDAGLIETVRRYSSFIDTVAARSDVRRVLVASATGYHGVLPRPMTDDWNRAIADVCDLEGWTYVDLTTPGVGIGPQAPHDAEDNHLDPTAAPLLRAAILEALQR